MKQGGQLKIGIIGAGHMGSTLARHFLRLGDRVSMANSRGPQSLAALAAETGVLAVDIMEVVREKDIVVIAVPQGAVSRLPRHLFSVAAEGTVVVDTGNYYPGVRDERIDAIEDGLTETEWVSHCIGVPVIKGFNNLFATSLAELGKPLGAAGRICLPVAGDHTGDKNLILALMNEIGFDGIDAGMLADSWKQQPGSPAYCRDLAIEEMRIALETAEHKKVAEYRAEAMEDARRVVEAAGSLAEAVAGRRSN